MLKTIAWFTGIALIIPMPANAECHFRVQNSIVCTSPRAAALVSQKFGDDTSFTNISYNRELMREAGCGRPYGKDYARIKISQINSRKIATPDGWVEVSAINANKHDLWYIARGYLSGMCEKYVPFNGNAQENKTTWVEPSDPSDPTGPAILHYKMPMTVTP